MESKELLRLMIGDVLMAYHDDGESQRNFPVIVDGLDENGTLVDGRCYISWKPMRSEDCNEEYADELKPVPLTAEILEKNGFHTNHDHTLLGSCIYRRMCGKYDEYEVVVRMLNGWIKIKSHDDRVTDILAIDIQPRFVHELQHALRLCGLTDLADNFVV